MTLSGHPAIRRFVRSHRYNPLKRGIVRPRVAADTLSSFGTASLRTLDPNCEHIPLAVPRLDNSRQLSTQSINLRFDLARNVRSMGARRLGQMVSAQRALGRSDERPQQVTFVHRKLYIVTCWIFEAQRIAVKLPSVAKPKAAIAYRLNRPRPYSFATHQHLFRSGESPSARAGRGHRRPGRFAG
jgi:hypothetical protein